jgi:hypothetical protein
MSDPELTVSERMFQDQVMQLAATCGWDCHHIRPAKYGTTWKTDGLAGMPDLILIGKRGQGIIWAELKTRTGKLSPIQEARIKQLLENGQEVHVWRPADLERIATRLSTRLRQV